jgi:Tfp pilus assembly protein PilN
MLQKIEKILYQHWWFFLILFLFFVVYRVAIKKKQDEISFLTSRIQELQVQKEQKTQQKEDLISRIEAQNDPAWIEQVLKKEIGVVPDGQMKVHFSKEQKK